MNNSDLYQPEFIRVETVGTHVSERCHLLDDRDGGVRAVFIDGIEVFRYRIDNKVEEKSVWVQVCLRGFAAQEQVADANDFSLRSLHYWVARYREEGPQGLINRSSPGAPKKITEPVFRRICALRDEGLKKNEIASALHISVRSVGRALRDRRLAREAATPLLNIGENTQDAPERSEPQSESAAAALDDEPAFASVEPTGGEWMAESSDHGVAKPPVSSAPALLADAVEDALARDRSADRVAAALGQLQDAPPLFHSRENVRFAGAFLAVAYLASDPYLDSAVGLYGQFKAAFYGTRTIFLNLLLMLLLRFPRVEHLKKLCPQDFGFVLGLDRSPEPATLRRRLTNLAERDLGAELMGELAAARCPGGPDIVYVDDHVQVYHGKRKLGKVFSNRTKRADKGRSEQWAHGPDGTALFVIESEFNESLIEMLPKLVDELRAALGVETLDLSFDRAGCSGAFLKALKDSPHSEFTVYRRRPYKDIPAEELVFEETRIGNSTYQCRPHDHDVEINVYGEVPGSNGKVRRQVVDTVLLREIRLVRPDGTQVAVLTSHARRTVSAEDVVIRPQGRWGSQENALKYARENFDLDGLWTYRTEPVTDSGLDHPNPGMKKLQKQRTAAKKERERIYRRYGKALVNDLAETEDSPRRPKVSDSHREQVAELDARIEAFTVALAAEPERETAAAGRFETLCGKMRLLQNAAVLSADHIERSLLSMLGEDFARREDEGRALVAAALHSSGSVRLAPGKLLVQLAEQSSPHRTRAVNALCGKLNALRARYPGSARVLEFIPTPAPPPPAFHRWRPRPEKAN